MKLTIATNVSNADLPRIKHILPHWLKVFDVYLDELLIVFDKNNLSGRIKDLHKQAYTSAEIYEALDVLKQIDPRVKVIDLDRSEIKPISNVWFKKGAPFRCQNGSPIYPFIYAIHKAKNDFILKCDCDIVFYEAGFVKEAYNQLNAVDIVSPPRNPLPGHVVSSRGFFINRKSLYENKLPIPLGKLSFIQIAARIARRQNIFDSKKSSLFFSLENAINTAIDKRLLTHTQLSKQFGNSMHVISNAEAKDEFIVGVIDSFVNGIWPAKQETFSMDYSKPLWTETTI